MPPFLNYSSSEHWVLGSPVLFPAPEALLPRLLAAVAGVGEATVLMHLLSL
jgi:hypothetical protein